MSAREAGRDRMTWEHCPECGGSKQVKGKPCIRCTDAQGRPTGKILYSCTGEKPPRDRLPLKGAQ